MAVSAMVTFKAVRTEMVLDLSDFVGTGAGTGLVGTAECVTFRVPDVDQELLFAVRIGSH